MRRRWTQVEWVNLFSLVWFWMFVTFSFFQYRFVQIRKQGVELEWYQILGEWARIAALVGVALLVLFFALLGVMSFVDRIRRSRRLRKAPRPEDK